MFESGLDSLLAMAESCADSYESILNSKSAKAADVAASLALLDESVKSYNKQVTENVQDACLADDKPMLFALINGFQDRLIKVVKKDAKTNVWSASVTVDENRDTIDILKLHKAEPKVSKDARWVQFMPALRRFVGVAVAKAVKDVNADSLGYAIKKAELGLNRADLIGHVESIMEVADLKEDADPFSIGSLLKITQVLVDMILGDDAPAMRRKDVRFIILLAAKESKVTSYKIANDKVINRLFQKAVYAALKNLDYEELVK